jgi:hypothetical protein
MMGFSEAEKGNPLPHREQVPDGIRKKGMAARQCGKPSYGKKLCTGWCEVDASGTLK